MRLQPISDYVLTPHAEVEMARRRIEPQLIRKVLAAPEQVVSVRNGRVVVQSRVSSGSGKGLYLVRIVVDTDREPPEVVTAYRTSKVKKYWRVPYESDL